MYSELIAEDEGVDWLVIRGLTAEILDVTPFFLI